MNQSIHCSPIRSVLQLPPASLHHHFPMEHPEPTLQNILWQPPHRLLLCMDRKRKHRLTVCPQFNALHPLATYGQEQGR